MTQSTLRAALFLVTLTFSGLAAAQDLNPSFAAYVWANQPAAASYSPSSFYTYNPGGSVTITRSSAGTYAVRLAGSAGAAEGSNVQVTPYEYSGVRCQVRGWDSDGSDLVVGIACFAAGSGTPTDALYTVLVTKASGTAPGLAYVWADMPSAASYTPNPTWTHNPGGTVTITRSATGRYIVRFTGIPASAYGGTVMVTSYSTTGAGELRRDCQVDAWTPLATLEIDVYCVSPAGTAADSRFSLLFIPSGTATPGLGFAFVLNETITTPYNPPPERSYNWSGNPITVSRIATGLYNVSFAGLGDAVTALRGRTDLIARVA